MAKQSFEDKIKELQNIVAVLEDEGSSLEECIKLYDKGTRLAVECNKILDEAETRILKMTDNGEGGFTEEKFISEEG